VIVIDWKLGQEIGAIQDEGQGGMSKKCKMKIWRSVHRTAVGKWYMDWIFLYVIEDLGFGRWP
jgi:hypothetical protein